MQNPKVTADRAFNGFGTNYENSPEPIYGTQVRRQLKPTAEPLLSSRYRRSSGS